MAGTRKARYELPDAKLPTDELYLPTTKQARRFEIAVIISLCVIGATIPLGVIPFLIAIVAVGGAFVVWSKHVGRDAPQIESQLEIAAQLARGGHDAAATEKLEELLGLCKGLPGLHSYVLQNHAVMLNRRGEPEAALTVLAGIAAGNDGAFFSENEGWFLVTVASAYAMIGDTESATRFRDLALQKLPPERGGGVFLPTILIDLRKEEWRDALARLEGGWSAAERVVGAFGMRRFHVLKAYAMYRLDAEAHGSEIAEALAKPGVAEDAYVGYLATRWPELRAFLDARGLGA